MDKQKAIWWLEMIFNFQEFECIKNNNEKQAKEIKEAKEYIIEHLKDGE